MLRRKLCPHCKIGKRTYQLDSRSPMCPYIHCYKGRTCAMYEKLDEHKKQNIFECIVDKVFAKGQN